MPAVTNRIDVTITPTAKAAAIGSDSSSTTARLLDQMAMLNGGIRILRLAQVINITGLGKTKIYELQEEDFPQRVHITSHCVGWIEAEVQAWLAQRVQASRKLQAK